MSTDDTVTREHIEASRALGIRFHNELIPLIKRWAEKLISEGAEEASIMICLTAESLALAGQMHLGDRDLFLRMAQRVIDGVDETLPNATNHATKH